MSSEKLLSPDDAEEDEKVEMSFWMKSLNYIFCRGDINDEKLETKPLSLEELFRYASPSDRRCLIVGIISSCLTGFNEPAMTILLGSFTKVFLTVPISSGEFLNETLLYMFLSFLVFLFSVATTFVQFVSFHRVCTNVTARIRTEYIRSVLRQEAAWFDKHSSGALTTQLNDNIDRIRDGIGDKLGRLVGVLSMLIACMVVSFATEWRIALCLFPVVPAAVCCMNILDRKLTSVSLKEMEFVGKAGTVAEESIFGVRTVQSLNGQEDMVERYRKQLVMAGKESLMKNLWTGLIMGLLFFILYAFQAGGVMIGGYLLTVNLVSDAGAVVTAVLAMLYASYDMGQITPQLMVILNARVAGAVVYKIIDRIPEVFVNIDMGKEIDVVGDVEFKDVRFSYPTRKSTTVLDGFSLSIPRSCTVALVGHSGCGKSTAIGLLCRLYEVDSGKVLIDGVDVKNIKLSRLREIVGVVQQEPSLFSDTIRENITMGNNIYRDEDIERVCRMANAHEFINQLSEGYDTVIGEGGVQLSGGQKQRIAIARALIRNPRILLLDEATSALDVHSEAIVQEALDRASVGRTTIVIAHRLSTVINADVIVVMDKGKIIEKGSHSQLMAASGFYANMQNSQVVKEEKHTSSTSASNDTITEKERAVTVATLTEDEEDEDHADDVGLLAIYSEAAANHGTLVIFCLFVATLHGLEMPGNAVVWALVVEAMNKFHQGAPNLLGDLEFKCWLMAGLGFYYMITSIVGSSLFAYLAERFIVDLRTRTFRNILHQDAAYFDNSENSPGKIITRLASDASNIQAVVDTRILNVFSCIAAWIVTISISLMDCWPLGVLFIVLSALLGWFMYSLTDSVHRRSMDTQKQNSAGKISVEIIEKVRTIQLFSSEKRFYFKYEDALKAVTDTEAKNGVVEVSVSAVFLFTAAGFTLGSLLLSHQLFTVDDVYRAALLGMIACIAIKISSTFNPEVVRAKTAAALMFRMMNRSPATGDSRLGVKKMISGNIKMQDVHFAYPHVPQTPVLRGLDFTVSKGQTAAIVGPSGSGKSTVISLLERYYDVTNGSLNFDDVNIRQRSLHHLRKQVAMVGQEPRLFSGTIKDNVCLGMEELREEKVLEALHMANAEKFVTSLPMGLDTEVGEGGTQLSGGQKQRIAIARALVREPVVLLLDEATSALDGESEKAVQSALDEARKGRTCITIAHRLSSIRNASVIFFVKDGQIRESGTHAELVQKRGLYYDLLQKQSV